MRRKIVLSGCTYSPVPKGLCEVAEIIHTTGIIGMGDNAVEWHHNHLEDLARKLDAEVIVIVCHAQYHEKMMALKQRPMACLTPAQGMVVAASYWENRLNASLQEYEKEQRALAKAE